MRNYARDVHPPERHRGDRYIKAAAPTATSDRAALGRHAPHWPISERHREDGLLLALTDAVIDWPAAVGGRCITPATVVPQRPAASAGGRGTAAQHHTRSWGDSRHGERRCRRHRSGPILPHGRATHAGLSKVTARIVEA